MSLRDTIVTKAVEAVERLTVRSALNPILWLCGLVTIPSILVASYMASVPTWLVLLACSPVAVALFGFLFLLFVDRDKLQSESYQLRKQGLELIEEKGDLRVIDAATIEAIANPDFPALPRSTSEGEG